MLSLIIINYNTFELTFNCIESIFKHSKTVDFEIIVIDNASSDQSLASLKKSFPSLTFIENSKNLGFAKACNQGATIAKGEYLFFLNSDTLFCNDVLSFFKDFMALKMPNIGCVGCFLKDGNGQDQISGYSFNSPCKEFKNYFLRWIKQKKGSRISSNNKILSVDTVTGADLLISKALFDKAGGFDEDFFMYYEDEYLQWKLKKLGYSSVLIGEAKIIHLENKSSGNSPKISESRRRMNEESMLLYYHKTRCKFHYFVFKVCFFMFIGAPLRFLKPFSQQISYFKWYWHRFVPKTERKG